MGRRRRRVSVAQGEALGKRRASSQPRRGASIIRRLVRELMAFQEDDPFLLKVLCRPFGANSIDSVTQGCALGYRSLAPPAPPLRPTPRHPNVRARRRSDQCGRRYRLIALRSGNRERQPRCGARPDVGRLRWTCRKAEQPARPAVPGLAQGKRLNFLKSGLRRSTNASRPSCASSER
jgi:hypothetical protein